MAKITADPHVEAVASFMLENIPTERLLSVAASLQTIAPALWGQYEGTSTQALSVSSTVEPRKQEVSSG
jgi:hypothetical protein